MTTVSAGATGGETLSGANTIGVGIASGDTASVTIDRAGVIIFSRALQHSEILGPFEDGDILSLTADRGAVDYIIAAYTAGTGLSGAFIDLSDVPSSYAGEGGKLVAVAGAETGLEFLAVSPLDIPIPADNEMGGVNITSAVGYIHLTATLSSIEVVTATGHNALLQGGTAQVVSSNGDATLEGHVNAEIQSGNGGVEGDVILNSGYGVQINCPTGLTVNSVAAHNGTVTLAGLTSMTFTNGILTGTA